MEEKKLIIFSDFDGTFTVKDVGNRIFTLFSDGRNEQLVADWKQGLISSRECLLREAELVKVSPEEFYSLLDSFELRAGAADLYQMSRENKIPFYIVSDGTDLYIEYLLKQFNMAEIPRYCNHGILEKGRLKLEFPHKNNGCTRCGSCKGERIREIAGSRRHEFEVVFVGDGLSDICAVPEADIIFARGDLLEYCRRCNIPAIEYQNFYDILNWLKNSGRIAG
ncbi:putative 2,3-diketo-5-methylthio-1-phosphopentanephosphat ase [Candidatus Zixiibacteriota bacterium]|nr:putative 2,3-diketo-5-methylthio-1-phosphopentanephosphat ase [candidate division Zixibacteria bacterium]